MFDLGETNPIVRKLMKMKFLIFFVLILIAPNLYAKESTSLDTKERVLIYNGFGTGADFLKMGEMQRYTYVLGAVNGMLVAPFFEAPMERMNWFESYTKTMDINQTADLLTRYIKSNPSRSKDGLNTLLYMAIREDYNERNSQGGNTESRR